MAIRSGLRHLLRQHLLRPAMSQGQFLRHVSATAKPRSVEFPGLAPASPEVLPSVDATPSVPATESTGHPVRLGAAAVEKLLELEEKNLKCVLRLTVNSGGCSGYSYEFRLEESSVETTADDIVINQGGARLIVDEVSMTFLEDCEIYYVQEMIRSSFNVVKNKLADSKCGCGTSFSISSF
eukprot:TRINITY_DN81457_c0_g1_i1.p1 TRINITY_DN81457_c0_g1~~TRINITY_DN81457_c0_g1_i1.p1  ORF type:complete len:193 (+),score=32.60 TRINITY_DN81457_c0_g1_i1:38-580(+)